jgi:hypothetical protein
MEPGDEQARVYEALRELEPRLSDANRDSNRNPKAIAEMIAMQTVLRKRLEELFEEVRMRSIQAAEEEQARIIAEIILK